MSRDFEELDYRKTPMGELTLRRRRVALLDGLEVFEVKLGEAFLMSSLFHVVEEALADLGLGACVKGDWNVVVGGLGLGYTAVAALAHDEVRSLVVIDVLEAVIGWHQGGLVPLGAELVADPRCRLVHDDFFARAVSVDGFDVQQPGRKFEAVLLDIDHSPRHLLRREHGVFYTEEGLRALAGHLSGEGVFALWSDDPPDEAFLELLRRVFAQVTVSEVFFDNPLLDCQSKSTIYVAVKG